ncbi:hypothetical protein EUA06_16595 [Nocardioides glacieisoli]|uniref:Uncharacterized protein n=1 Tax=Nocardioides glacieisoli TaxID=1168730 RepID=A0A4Q2RKZ5_9ACTN|nr:hypothetical protein [Nocardioides glacieisoli]RYB89108.1 hypothetical protein EUA06_16595 [Nocardioides glacieisoli]
MSDTNERVVTHYLSPPAQLPSWEQAPEDLRAMLGSGRSLLLIGRNSSSSGRTGAEAAAADLHGAAQELRSQFRLDVTECLPSIDDLATALMNTAAHKSVDPDGLGFINRYVCFVLPNHQIVLSVSAGSALKLDHKGLLHG